MIPDQIKKDYHLSELQMDQLNIWVQTLLKWQKKINLISSKTIDDLWSRHIRDSLQLKNLVIECLENYEKKDRLIYGDLGSGAGFPGLAVSMFWPYDVVLVEADERKSIFLKEVVRQWGENERIMVCNQRIEDLPKQMTFSLLTARGLAPLEQIFQWAYPHLEEDSVLVLPKGKNWENEKNEAKRHWNFSWKAQESQTSSQAMILKITQLELKNKET